jgi:hypothetical protein
MRGASERQAVYTEGMTTARYIYWQDGEQWLGYFEEYPDYVTQGDSMEDLQESLKDLFHDLTSGEVPGVRKAAELSIR